MAILTTMKFHLSFDKENLLKILREFCETLQIKDFTIENSVINDTFSKYFRFGDFTEFKDTLQESITRCKIRKSNDMFALLQSEQSCCESKKSTAIVKLHTKTDKPVSDELLSALNNATLTTYPNTKPENDLTINVLVAEYDTERNTLISHEEMQIFKPDKSLSDIKAQLINPTILTTRNIEPSVSKLLDEGVYQEGEIVSAKWLSHAAEQNDNAWLHVINHTGYYPNEEEVNEIFDILDTEAKLSYETLYKDFEEMMCSSKPGKELLLRILTRTMKDAVKHLEKITQEEK